MNEITTNLLNQKMSGCGMPDAIANVDDEGPPLCYVGVWVFVYSKFPAKYSIRRNLLPMNAG